MELPTSALFGTAHYEVVDDLRLEPDKKTSAVEQRESIALTTSNPRIPAAFNPPRTISTS
jgi:hypothetical protein